MNTNDPMIIVTLVANCPTAERAWNRSENRDRCKPAPESPGDVDSIPSREPTPAEPTQDHSKIHLGFDNKPKNLEKGFVFGSDPQKCDVLLGGWPSFSREHFRITFNARGDVILEDTSRVKTCVEYGGEEPSGRNHFTWILFTHYDNIELTLNKVEDGSKLRHTNELVFKIEWPENRDSCPAEYGAYRDAYLEARRNALPAPSQLGVESQQTTAVLTAQHSPRQQPIYLPEEELGRGSFGTVYKAVDVSTGYEYAAKKFHGGNWKREVEILKSLSHEHIVKFVALSGEQKPLLVMEYLPLGNLASQNRITEEETLQILYQGLTALKYLHSQTPPLTHRDIKPENILVQSRTPFAIKLVDFGFAKNDFSLKTFCGTDDYAAPEIWEHRHYTTMVDLWSLGVIVLQYGYGLPKPSRKRKGKPWCRDLVLFAEDKEGEGDALIDLISTKMLRMDYRYRLSASDCLGEVYRLGLHAILPIEIVHATPTGKTTGQDGIIRTESIISRPLGNIPSDSLWSPFHDIGGAWEKTEVAATKRELREGVHYHNLASPRLLGGCLQERTQMNNPNSKATTTLKKRRRPQTTQSPTADTIRRGQSKRSRSLLSNEAGGQLPKMSNLRQEPEQLERSVGLYREGSLAADVASFAQGKQPIPEVAPEPVREGIQSSSGREFPNAAEGRNTNYHLRSTASGNLNGENEVEVHQS
ncbi:MAG: hypothetical protein Q9178_005574 [Gyalolechia marmorata]